MLCSHVHKVEERAVGYVVYFHDIPIGIVVVS
jgi:hypothetical protein